MDRLERETRKGEEMSALPWKCVDHNPTRWQALHVATCYRQESGQWQWDAIDHGMGIEPSRDEAMKAAEKWLTHCARMDAIQAFKPNEYDTVILDEALPIEPNIKVQFASVGSTIETKFSDGTQKRMVINTPLACAEANELIMSGRWRVVDQKTEIKQ